MKNIFSFLSFGKKKDAAGAPDAQIQTPQSTDPAQPLSAEQSAPTSAPDTTPSVSTETPVAAPESSEPAVEAAEAPSTEEPASTGSLPDENGVQPAPAESTESSDDDNKTTSAV